jgi:choline dehydrogenase
MALRRNDFIQREGLHTMSIDTRADGPGASQFLERARTNQARLVGALQPHYDFVVCGAGSSGSVVARRLAENPDVSVLLVEAGGDDNVPSVTQPGQWVTNIGTERDWGFQSQPNFRVNDRSIPFSMGKVLGGGSSINLMVWARGHRNDWDLFAAEAADPAWNYDSVLATYRSIEDWHGAADPAYRGTGGPVFVQPAPSPNPLAPATVEGACSVGIPTFESPNGAMMETAGGAALADLRIRHGRRESVFRSYVFPHLDRPNLTVLTMAHVNRIAFEGRRASGVEVVHQGITRHIGARHEVVLSLGAIHTPKVLMLSGIGDEEELKQHGIPVLQHLPGVGRNFQDHVAFDCVWEYRVGLPPRNGMSEATMFWNSQGHQDSPDMFACQGEIPHCSPENAARYGLPDAGWSLRGTLTQPKSRGSLHLTGPSPDHPIRIDANTFSEPDDVRSAIACVERCREIGNSAPLRPFVKREVMPGNATGHELETFVRNAATSFWHQTGTAKMGQDTMSVVNGALEVYGIEKLRIADGSIMPRITTGNTMAPCVIIGERAAEFITAEHSL